MGSQGNEIACDQASGKVWDIIKLHSDLRGVPFGQALKELADWDGSTPLASIQVADRRKSSTARASSGNNQSGGSDTTSLSDKIGVRTATHPDNSIYLRTRGLTMPTWVKMDLNAYVDECGNLCYSAVCGKKYHVKGGKYKTRNKAGEPVEKNFTGWWSPYAGQEGTCSFSMCGKTHGASAVNIYEGISDFLALIAYDTQSGPEECHVILNSAANTSKFAETIAGRWQSSTEVRLLLDADKAGDTATAQLLETFAAAGYTSVKDYRESFLCGANDVYDAVKLMKGGG